MENEAKTLDRAKVCGECSQSTPKPDGGIQCRVCGCPDPIKMRPRCPIGKWGLTPLAACVHYQAEGDGKCAKGHTDCAGCPDKSNEEKPADPPVILPEGTPPKPDDMAVACGIRSECLKGTPADCAHCPWLSALSPPKGVVVISSRDEGDDLRLTIAAILTSSKFVKGVIVVDDASETPENVFGLGDAVRLIRLEENAGVAGARHRGIAVALESGDFDTGAIFDAHMKPADRGVDMILRYAQVHRCFCYAGVIGHLAADLRNVNGLFECKWINRGEVEAKKQRFHSTTGMMGASYAFPLDIVSDMGGWIWFPGQWGKDEEAMSLLCLRHKIPIIADAETQNFHKFWYDPNDQSASAQAQPRRKFSIPQNRFLVNVAALHRIFFEDKTWEHFKPILAASGISDILIHEVEQPEIVAYGAALRERFKTSEAEFWMSFVPKGKP